MLCCYIKFKCISTSPRNPPPRLHFPHHLDPHAPWPRIDFLPSLIRWLSCSPRTQRFLPSHPPASPPLRLLGELETPGQPFAPARGASKPACWPSAGGEKRPGGLAATRAEHTASCASPACHPTPRAHRYSSSSSLLAPTSRSCPRPWSSAGSHQRLGHEAGGGRGGMERKS
eukprot:764266-Hanusia_phi.AAC.6